MIDQDINSSAQRPVTTNALTMEYSKNYYLRSNMEKLLAVCLEKIYTTKMVPILSKSYMVYKNPICFSLVGVPEKQKCLSTGKTLSIKYMVYKKTCIPCNAVPPWTNDIHRFAYCIFAL